MDLNKAMVEMYKKRSLNNSRNSSTKKPKPQSSPKPENELAHHDDHLLQRPKITFDKLYGCEAARDKLLSYVSWFQNSILIHGRKLKSPILICGSRGLGKTSIVEAVASYSKFNFIKIDLKLMVDQTRSSFETELKQIVNYCRSKAPAILLVDDLHEIADKEELKLILTVALRKLLTDDYKLLIFCTTTSPNNWMTGIDFHTTLQLKRPNQEARFKIMKTWQEEEGRLKNFTEENLKLLATKTPSFTPFDLQKMLSKVDVDSQNNPTLSHCDSAIADVKGDFKRGTYLIGERPSVTWADIGGLNEVRKEFSNIMKKIRQGDDCKFAGILLYGPPGCGKTMVAQAMANEAGLNFIAIKSTELVDKFLGETEKNIRQVFMEAKEFEPCLIYFDEFDGLCGTRGKRDNLTSAVQALLSEMDGFDKRGKSIILASTNRLEDIDPAIKRSGRLTKHLEVGPPNESARKTILTVLTGKSSVSLAPDVDLNDWARKTENFSGADLDFLVSEALDISNGILKQEDLEHALLKVRASNRELDKKIERLNNS